MAHQRGAASVLAFDIDTWAVENSQENFDLNDAAAIRLFQGTVQEVDADESFDIILANINRNVLLDEMERYAQHLSPGGVLLLSGFYEADLPLIREAITAQRLTEGQADSREQWVVLLVRKGLNQFRGL